MVSEWLKLEFIEAFFTVLAEQHTGDNRRLKFWARYVSVIEDIHFALGADARDNSSPDFKALRKKMTGLVIPLQLRRGDTILSMFGTVTVFGTPVDITLAELAVEAFYPADPATAAVLRAMAG